LRSKVYNKPILGYTDKSTVKLDFDKTRLKTVKYWANRVCKFFKLQGFIILRSSCNSYRIVFNKTVTWTENVTVMGWTCLMSKNKNLTGYFILQCIKGASTLRIGKKLRKKPPRIICHYGKRDCEIKNYLAWRKFILSC
jgi:hypothetical protein